MKFTIVTLAVLSVIGSCAASNGLDEFNNGNHQFTADLYNRLIKGRQDKNFVFSPLTVAISLGIARIGANGKSADEITEAVGLPKDNNDLVKSLVQLGEELKSDQFKLHQAVGFYTSRDVNVTDSFKTDLEKCRDAKLETVDFSNATDVVENINKWVGVQTKHKIKHLLSEDEVSKTSQLVLINAVYFNATWKHKFTMLPTKKRFSLSRTNSVMVDMMTVTNHFRYYDLGHIDAKAIELPYEGKDASMVVVLPNAGYWGDLSNINNNLAKVIEITTADECKDKCSMRDVTVEMPIFSVWARYRMQQDLNQLGIETAFSEDADFTNMADGSIKIHNFIQKAYINVTTEGTVATAANDNNVQFRYLSSMRHQTPDRTVFNVQHGFMYYIKLSNTIIMAGKTSHMR
ncbi:unnamed protein product [Ceutorhynchus assimilis]|uniref:Serpin domain-containing protein n=1 Tax=Ceutorhynchus assimilis TaxID=467358 RepID=A0A9N9MVT7_9CUCU|nr:unnamed protein product [Ceutorhynchus assimilis]